MSDGQVNPGINDKFGQEPAKISKEQIKAALDELVVLVKKADPAVDLVEKLLALSSLLRKIGVL